MEIIKIEKQDKKPIKDLLDLHEHVYKNNVCVHCNKINIVQVLSSTKGTSNYELEKEYLQSLVHKLK